MAGPFLARDSADTEDVAKQEEWKLDMGAQCNRLLERADVLEKSLKAANRQFAADLRSIVKRVAEFEKLDFSVDYALQENSETMGYHNLSSEQWDVLNLEQQDILYKKFQS